MSTSSDVCRLDVTDESIDLSNGLIMVSFNIRLGTIALSDIETKQDYFTRAYMEVHTDKQVFDSRKMTYRAFSSLDFEDERGHAKSVVLKLVDPEKTGEMNIRITVTNQVRGYWCAVQFKSRMDDCVLQAIDPLVIDVDSPSRVFLGRDGKTLRFFRNGFHSWELSQAKQIVEGENRSHLFSVLKNLNKPEGMLLGFVSAKDQFTTVTMFGRKKIEERLAQIVATSLTDDITVNNGNLVVSEELSVIVGQSAHDCLKIYTNLLGLRMNAIYWEEVPVGWCSWYFYYTMPDENEIIANAEFLRSRYGNQIEWIQLDDGFQKTVGDWTENSRFGSGLAKLVDHIHKNGFKAGIWTAPFIATEHSEIFKDRPDWFVRDDDNKPIIVERNPLWLGDCYALDLTNPQVIESLKILFSNLKRYGYEYFKIDFLHQATVKGRRHDMNMTRAQALRQGLEAIREAVGDALILGCGAPLGPCIGITNAMRIGTDIATSWRYDWGGGVYECSVNTMSRAIMHNRLWINDPDCVLVRQDDNELTLDEVKLWLSITALSGGILMLSDRMEEVTEDRLQLIDKVLPVYRKGAIAIDALDREEPSVFALPIETPIGRWAVVSVANLSENSMDVKFGLPEIGLPMDTPCHIFDFWEEVYEGVSEDSVEIKELKPHTAKLLLLRPEEMHPTLLSTSMHFTQGAVEIGTLEWDEKTRDLELTIVRSCKSKESVYIVFGTNWSPNIAFIDDTQVKFESPVPEVISISHRFQRGQSIRVNFSMNN